MTCRRDQIDVATLKARVEKLQPSNPDQTRLPLKSKADIARIVGYNEAVGDFFKLIDLLAAEEQPTPATP